MMTEFEIWMVVLFSILLFWLFCCYSNSVTVKIFGMGGKK